MASREILKKNPAVTDLSLLTNNWCMIFKFDVIEESFNKDVGDPDQTVIFLRLIERIVLAGWCVILHNVQSSCIYFYSFHQF